MNYKFYVGRRRRFYHPFAGLLVLQAIQQGNLLVSKVLLVPRPAIVLYSGLRQLQLLYKQPGVAAEGRIHLVFHRLRKPGLKKQEKSPLYLLRHYSHCHLPIFFPPVQQQR